MSTRRHNFGTKRFKEKSLFIFHARIALKSLILLFVRLIARGARIGKHTQTHRHTDRTSTVTLAHARRGLIITSEMQSIGQAKHTVLMVTGNDPMATYHFADCVHWHKMKINVSIFI